MSAKHSGEFAFAANCEIEVSTTDELGNPSVKKKEFECGKLYWVDTVTHKSTGLSDIKFYDGFTIVDVDINDIGSLVGTPDIVGELPKDEDAAPADESAEDAEKPKPSWFSQ